MSARTQFLAALAASFFAVSAQATVIAANAGTFGGIPPCTTDCPPDFTTVIQFGDDEIGPKANGFRSTGHPEVTFSDTVGTDLLIYDLVFGVRRLAVLDNDASALRMDFAVNTPINMLSITHDIDPSLSPDVGDAPVYAYLQLLLGDELLSETVEQFSGSIRAILCCDPFSTFDNARFVFTDAVDEFGSLTPAGPLPLIEVVDSIEYGWSLQGGGGDGDGDGGGVVPEPGSVVLLGLVLAGMAASRRYVQ
jgi:hypothetical protein